MKHQTIEDGEHTYNGLMAEIKRREEVRQTMAKKTARVKAKAKKKVKATKKKSARKR